MSKKQKLGGLGVLTLALLAWLVWYLHHTYVSVLEPRGTIGEQEKHLIVIAILLAVIVVLPVYALLISISLKYREGNDKARYSPDWDHNRLMEITWWAIPGAIILVLSVITWNSSHSLDPFKSINSSAKPLNIQVVSLDWKWLFIYPDQQVATVNDLEFPQNVPLNLHLTSDSVMNSFWVPALGSQIYTMPGMDTQLHLMSNKLGIFHGSSANISGVGFAGMDFTAQSVSSQQFNGWINTLKKSSLKLSMDNYGKVSRPSQNNPVTFYSGVNKHLYDYVVLKYSAPSIRFAANQNYGLGDAGL